MGILDISLIKQYDLQERSVPDEDEHDYCDKSNTNSLNEYKQQVITYMSGFVVKMCCKALHCPQCIQSLTVNDYRTVDILCDFINFRNRGGLVKASPSVVKVCIATERCIQRMINANAGNIPNVGQSSSIVLAISTIVLQETIDKGVFEDLYTHMFDSSIDDNHVYKLVKLIAQKYIKIRMHHMAKQFNESFAGEKIRKVLNKLILFKHQ